MHEYRNIYWNIDSLSWSTSLKKTDCLSSSSHQLTIALQLGLGLPSLPYHCKNLAIGKMLPDQHQLDFSMF